MSFGGFQSSNGWQLKSPQYYIPNPKSQFDDQICENQKKRKTDFDAGVSGSTVLGVSNTMPCGVISQPRLAMPLPRNTSKAVYGSPGLSLTLTSGGGESQGEVNVPGISEYEQQQIHQQQGRSRDEDYESRSGSDNLDGASGDEQDTDLPPRKKRYHRHTPQQIQELESLFKECPHPDEKQRAELSKRLNLETRQVKFWFQNRRTQMKTQLERHENSILRQENEKLRVENMSIKEAMRNPICSNCGGPAVLGDMSLEEQQLRIENARLKEELDRLCTLAGKFFGRPVHPSMPMPVVSTQSLMPKSTLDLGVGAVMNPTTTQSMMLSLANNSGSRNPMGLGIEKSMMAELAVAAMDEFIKMAQAEEPLWVSSLDTTKENLNYEEYLRQFSSIITPKPMGLTTEATRESGVVMIRSLNLVDSLMDAERWKDMFPCIVSRAAVVDVITSGLGGTRNGALQLMYAELQVLSPFVQAREVYFLRFCKQHAEGIWAVVDVSVDSLRDIPHPPTAIKCRRFPSGCLIQEMPNGSCKVTWMEHAEYDDREVHRHYKTLINSGMAFGAQRWLATLQRQCDCIAVLMSARDSNVGIAIEGKRSMLKLAQRMTENFYAGINASSTAHVWKKLSGGSGEDDVRIMTRKSMNDPGEPAGMVLSAATSLWLPVSPHRLFHFLRDERLRSEWDILSNGSPMQEMTHIPKGQDPGNSVSILRASGISGSQNEMVILQETWTDASGSMVVYAPVDIPAMQSVLSGGDPAFVEVLPSGFAIVADGPEYRPVHGGAEGGVGGSLMSVAFQIVADTVPTAKPNVQSVETANTIITRTVRRIKAALHCEDG